MKRLIAFGLTLTFAIGLFSFGVNAATTDITYTIDYGYTSGTDTTTNYVNRTTTFVITLQNNTDFWLVANRNWFRVNANVGEGGTIISREVTNTRNCSIKTYPTSTGLNPQFYVYPVDEFVMAPREKKIISFDYTYVVYGTNTYTFSANTSDLPNPVQYTINELLEYDLLPANVLAYIEANRYWLEIIAKQTSNVAGADDLNTDASSSKTQSDTNHQLENSYYQQNESALNASGIRNPNFEAEDREAIGTGFSSVKSVFNGLWSVIGPLRNIYMYTLLIGLATFLIKHRGWVSVKASESVIRDKNGDK